MAVGLWQVIVNPFNWDRLLKGLKSVPAVFGNFVSIQRTQDNQGAAVRAITSRPSTAPDEAETLASIKSIIHAMMGLEVRSYHISVSRTLPQLLNYSPQMPVLVVFSQEFNIIGNSMLFCHKMAA